MSEKIPKQQENANGESGSNVELDKTLDDAEEYIARLRKLDAITNEFNQLYPSEDGLVANAPLDVFDTFSGLKDAYLNTSGTENDIASVQLDTFISGQREKRRVGDIVEGELSKFRESSDYKPLEAVPENVENPFSNEGTRLEWKNTLRGLIEGAKEKVSWYSSSEEKLIRRNAELDAEFEKIGATEKYFRNLGEWYNKRNWKTKLAVGAGLGLGAAFSAGVSLPIALTCLSGVAAQRIAGLSTMYLKFEKKSHEEAWGKEKAFLKAAVYTAVMGLAIKEGIEYVSETESAHVVQRWLGEMLGHHHAPVAATLAPEQQAEAPKAPASAPEVAKPMATAASAPEQAASAPVAAPEAAPAATAPASAPAPESAGSAAQAEIQADVANKPAAAAAASGEAAPHGGTNTIPDTAPKAEVKLEAPATTEAGAEIPEIEVKATPGHGYEYMMKRLWVQLQEKKITLPSGANPESDLAKLLAADEKTIDGVVHRLAQDNEFFKGDGTNVRIDLDSKMTLDTHGNIWMNDTDILAPESAPVTPAYHPDASAVAPEAHGVQSTEVNGTEAAKFAEILNRGSSIISPEFNTYFDKHLYDFSDGEILKIKTILLDTIRNGENENLKEIFAGKQPGDLKIGTYLGNIELITGTVDGQEVGASFKPDASFDTQMHINGLSNPGIRIPVPVPEPSHIDVPSSQTIPEVQATPAPEAPASSSEASPAPVPEHSVINKAGFEISTTQPHLYTGKGDSIIAFGGQKADRLKEMFNYLKSHPGETIIAADDSERFRAVWSLNAEGKLEQGDFIQKRSFFGFLIPDSSPSPDDLKELKK